MGDRALALIRLIRETPTYGKEGRSELFGFALAAADHLAATLDELKVARRAITDIDALLATFITRDGKYITVNDHQYLDEEFFDDLFKILDPHRENS